MSKKYRNMKIVFGLTIVLFGVAALSYAGPLPSTTVEKQIVMNPSFESFSRNPNLYDDNTFEHWWHYNHGKKLYGTGSPWALTGTGGGKISPDMEWKTDGEYSAKMSQWYIPEVNWLGVGQGIDIYFPKNYTLKKITFSVDFGNIGMYSSGGVSGHGKLEAKLIDPDTNEIVGVVESYHFYPSSESTLEVILNLTIPPKIVGDEKFYRVVVGCIVGSSTKYRGIWTANFDLCNGIATFEVDGEAPYPDDPELISDDNFKNGDSKESYLNQRDPLMQALEKKRFEESSVVVEVFEPSYEQIAPVENKEQE